MDEHMPEAALKKPEIILLNESIAKELVHYSVGFSGVIIRDNIEDATLLGSGTLVTIGERYGILTAQHVVSKLRSCMRNHTIQETGLILMGFPQGNPNRMTFSLETCAEYTVSLGSFNSEKDLSFLELPQPQVSELKARKSFYNLNKRCESILQSSPSLEDGIWVLIGLAGEWTKDRQVGKEGPIKVFEGKQLDLGPITASNYRKSGDLDYFDFRADYSEEYDGPDDFGGYSGGGVWQIIVKPDQQNKMQIEQYILMGVAFYQSEKKESQDVTFRTITCHGYKSIYEQLLKRVNPNYS